ncbi:dCMP deaminase [[Clostridium] propionicum DSM 1682]|uniref:dCMP deaminase n=2 Tax=Anaerotignum propionicum TaxID=28446 RepID=A0A0X8VC51_ANAPI|nr:tRNA-specific adenosine deaminase [Anaerotignum propionicum DSM 1682]SHE45696.1 dCMP deaminase [[Clostridium] propionicum DSM 1682] [Anaerotignum propionicum DSM 1682]
MIKPFPEMKVVLGKGFFRIQILTNSKSCAIFEKTSRGMEALRASWDEYFMQIAEIVKTRSTCLRRQVGAVIVKDNRIITTGYNGAPSGLMHCTELGGCERERLGIPSGQRHELCRALHAEQNAIIQAANLGISTDDGTIYITLQPCVICAKMLINAGIKRIVHKGEYPDELSRRILEEAKIEITIMAE